MLSGKAVACVRLFLISLLNVVSPNKELMSASRKKSDSADLTAA